MNKKFTFRKLLLIIVLTALVASAVGISVMSVSKYKLNADTFNDDGYMLLASKDKSSDAINEQHYFNAGESYRKTIDDTIVFTDINGTKVNAEKENFVHYQSGSMNALAETVVLDTDHVDPNEQVSYYSVPEKTTLVKNGSQYTINNAGNNINLTNIVWKVSNDRYMIVSPTIDLVISEESEQNFTDYVELRYIDEGVVHLVTQDGTYSTVSSDAYLELKNGVRIYIGSKNISNGESILMNMSQMVVGSDDNIEVIPDEDYTIENEEQPQIVINASDGEDGEGGLDGEKGNNGGNRADGTDGKNGVAGDPGNNAPNANVMFEPEVAPIFKDISLDTRPYGVVIDELYYDANGCTVDDAWISIVDVATGNEVWKKNIKGILPGDPSISMDEIECDTLHADTEYRMNIHTTYSSPQYPDQKISQAVSQELFYTDSYGFSLTKQAITAHSINLNLNKDLEAGVNSLRIRLFDENMNDIGFYDPIDQEIHPSDSEYHTFDVFCRKDEDGNIIEKALDVNESIEVAAKGLNSNSIYYAQIQIMGVDDVEGDPGEVPTIIPTNSYPKQKYLTKKIDPVLEKPTVRVDEVSKTFVVTPGQVTDKDNGVIGYRLEIYEVKDYGTDGSTPCYTYNVQTPSLTSISIPIADDGEDDEKIINKKLKRNEDYYAHIVAVFDDNEEIVDFRSPRSDKFRAGEGKGPTVKFVYDRDYATASTIEGKIVITDTSSSTDKHTFPEDSLIRVEYLMNSTSSGGDDIENKTGIVTEFEEMAIPISAFTHDGFEYSYPISLKSLKANTSYNLIVYSSEFYIDGVRHGKPEEFEYVDEDKFSTKDNYSPILVKSNDIRGTNADYTTSMFAISLQFAPSDEKTEETYRTYDKSIVPGLGNVGDMSIRSTTYLVLDLYVGVGEEPDRPVTHIDTVQIKDLNNWKRTDGSIYKPSYIDTVDIESDKTVLPIYGENDYGYVYSFNGSIYDDSYSFSIDDLKTIHDEDSSLILTDSIFTDPVTGYNPVRDDTKYPAGTQFFIKVSAYDYTYGLGEGYNINGKGNNKIPVGNQDNDNIYITNSLEDAWVSFYTSYAVPAIPQNYPYCENYLRLGTTDNNIKAQFASDATYYENPSDSKKANIHLNNLTNAVIDAEDVGKTNKQLLEDLMSDEGIADTTAIGITYCAPSTGKEGLAQYCSSDVPSVCYNIYKLVYNSDKEDYDEVLVNTSGWMNYIYINDGITTTTTTYKEGEKVISKGPTMPTYTFFYDVEDKETHKSISRGEKYIVETQLRLKGNETHKINEGTPEEEIVASIYPNYWHEETHTLPGDTDTERTYRVFDKLESNRQMPSILSVPYDGNVNNEEENSDKVYLIIVDPDSTLDAIAPEDGDTYKKVNIYKGVYGADGKPDIYGGESLFGTVSGVLTIDSQNVSYVTGNALSEGNLYAKYSLNEENDRLAKYSYIKLMSEEKVTKSKTITMIDTGNNELPEPTEEILINDGTFNDFTYTFIDQQFIGIDFKYQTSNPKDVNGYNELLGADVIFTKYVYYDETSPEHNCKTNYTDACKLEPANEGVKDLTIFTTPTYNDWEQIQVDDPDNPSEKMTIYNQKGQIKIDAIDVADIINCSDAIGIKLALYYDSGDYGIKYFDSSDSITNKTSNYYLVQYADANGKASIPSASVVYPKNYYETIKKKGVPSVTDTKIKDIETPLFTRGEVAYTLSENRVSSGTKKFTITPIGLSGAIIKNVGSDVSNELVTKIEYIMPKAVPTDIKAGFSTAILDFKVFSADTVMKTGTDITIKYKKHSQDSYPSGNTVTVHYTPSTVDANDDRHWEDVVLSGLSPDGLNQTQYDYEIWGYANNGTSTGAYVKMYAGSFDVDHYDHYFGGLKVETYGSPKTRDTKRLSYTLNFKDIITRDIKNSLNSITVEMYKNEADIGDSSKAVSKKTENINTIFALASQDYYANYSYEIKLPWAPDSSKIHEMDDNTPYWIRVTYNYNSGDFDEPYKYKYFSLGEDSSSSIIGWDTFYSLNTYAITGIKNVEVIGEGTSAHPDYQLKFNIAGTDKNRLASLASDGNINFLVELCDDKGNVVQIKDDAIVETGGEYQRRLIEGVKLSNDGSFTTKGMMGIDAENNPIDNPLLTFKHLKPGEPYYINVYFVLDGQNINIADIARYLSLDETLITTKETIPDLTIVEKGSGVYELTSIKIRTESDGDLRIDSAILHPESNEAFMIGTNMNFVKRIRYVVNKNGVDIATVKLSGPELKDKFRQEEYSTDLYYLTIPTLLEDGAAYIVRIDFYSYDGNDWDNPTVTAQGIHGIEE